MNKLKYKQKVININKNKKYYCRECHAEMMNIGFEQGEEIIKCPSCDEYY